MSAVKFWNEAMADKELSPIMIEISSATKKENWSEEYAKFKEKILPYVDEEIKSSRVKRKQFFNQLEKKILQQSASIPSDIEVNKGLRKHLWFKGKPIKVTDLQGDYDKKDIVMKPDGNLEELNEILTSLAPLLNDVQNQRLTSLRNILEDRAKQRDIEVGAIKTKALKKLYREIGEFNLGDWNDRKEIYDYWKRISGMFEEFKQAKDDFVKAAKQHKEKLKANIAAEGSDEGRKRATEDFERFDSAGSIVALDKLELENYIGKFKDSDFTVAFPENFEKAVQIIQLWHETEGIDFKPKFVGGEHPQTGPVYEAKEIEADRSYDPTEEQEKITEEVGEKLDGIADGVDPLLYYQLEQEQFKRIKPKSSEVAEVKETISLILDIKSRGVDPETQEEIEEAYFSDSERAEFEEWFDEIIQDIRDIPDNEEFYLPHSNFTTSRVKIGAGITSKYRKFMELISELMEDEKTSFASYSRNLTEEDKRFKEGRFAPIGGSGKGPNIRAIHDRMKTRILNEPFNPTGKNMPPELDEKWLALLEAINEYISIPLTSEFMVEKDLPKWITELPSRVVEMQYIVNNPIGKFLKRTIRGGLGRVDPDDIDAIINFIDLIRNPTKGFDVSKTYNLGEDAVDGLDALWGDEFHNDNIESIGGIIQAYANKADFDEDLPDFMGKSIKDLFENYSFPRELDIKHKRYPILLLRNLLKMQTFKAYPKDWLGDLAPKLRELQRVFDSFASTVQNAEINLKLLEAHDMIRKMNGQQVIWARLSLDEISHMDDVINKMEKEHRVGITATEIDSIVKSVSSYDSLAKNHGVNEEVVYTVKAMFR